MVVVLPGGPGESSIGSDLGHVAQRYGVLFTDPRGIGCNAGPTDAYYPAACAKAPAVTLLTKSPHSARTLP